MFRLASILYSIVATSLAGAAIVAALVMGYYAVPPLVVAAGLGAVAALPISWMIARAILEQG